MIRTQVSLTEEQAERLRARAAAGGVSQASVVRQALDAYLERDELSLRLQRARSAVGAFRSGHRDTAERHDDALDEAFSS
jgi:predicted DNA-binding protein